MATRQSTGAACRRVESSKLLRGCTHRVPLAAMCTKTAESLSHVGICLCVLVNLLFDV